MHHLRTYRECAISANGSLHFNFFISVEVREVNSGSQVISSYSGKIRSLLQKEPLPFHGTESIPSPATLYELKPPLPFSLLFAVLEEGKSGY